MHSGVVQNQQKFQSRCLVPACDGVNLSSSQRRDLWDRFYTAAPRPRTPFEANYSARKLRSRASPKGSGSTSRRRSEERRGGKEGVRTGKSRWVPEHRKKNIKKK